MRETRVSRIFKNPYLWLFLVTSAMFGLLFIRFILGEYAYFYLDAGADTFDINYPLYYLFSDVFHSREYDPYFLNVGLGMDMSSYLYQYFNPLNLMVIALPQRLIPWGVLLATYLKLMTISMFGYKLMYRWIDHSWGAFAGAVLWTFSSYVMLWGQHYGFCTSIMMFTVFLYLVHLFVEDGEKSRNWLLVLWITMMLFTNYYFLYMSGIIGAMYVVTYLIIRKQSFRKILSKLLGLAGMGALGIAIGGVCLIPTYNIFTASTRVSAVNTRFLGILEPYTPKRLCAFLARLFSNNTMGIADDYRGAGNYYEIAAIFTSTLFFLGLPYLLQRKETRKPAWVLTVLSVLLLIMPISGKIFTMNAATQRWSFLLCLLESLAVGVYVKYLLTKQHRRGILGSTAAGLVLAGICCGAVFWGESQGYYHLDLKYLLISLIFLLIFAALVMMGGARRNPVFPLLLILVLCGELVVTNYPTINFRKNPTRNEVGVSLYNDGTREAWQEINTQDPSLYRVSKSYESASENDSLVQGYPGLSAYMTTNPESLIQLKEMYGAAGISDNFVYFNNDNFLLNTLLGTKYLFAQPGYGLSADAYSLVTSVGDKQVYVNNYALPFGYFYDSSWELEEVEKMEGIDKTLAALHGFYFTEEKSSTEYLQAVREETEGTSLLDREFQAADCQAEKTDDGIRMAAMTNDPHIVLENVEDAFGEGGVHTITMEVEAGKKVDMALYYRTRGDQGYSQDKLYIFHITPERDTWTYTIPGDVTGLRIDVSTEISDVTIKKIEVNNCAADNEALTKLRQSSADSPVWSDNIYQTQVNNTREGTQMLCIPFLYSEGWECLLDDSPGKVYNINSGLCGIEIPPGTHQIQLRYQIPHEMAGIALSCAGLLIYVLWMVYSILGKSRKVKS